VDINANDFIVLGSGQAGQRRVVQGAKLGRSGLLVEQTSQLGGSCRYTGPILSKTLREARAVPDQHAAARILRPQLLRQGTDHSGGFHATAGTNDPP
jgi:pyruvate/2-oxoglutarate dehydrogenase complex dihydrolipoamide dehydrogenase (E3) component